VRPATLASCRDSLLRLAVFDDWQLETIRAANVEDHVFAVAAQAPRAAELMLDTLKMILRSAKERGQTIDEAVLRVRPPRRERAEMRFLDWNEIERLAVETVEPYRNLVRFACLTGLRQGELFALRDRALDLPRRTIVVESGARDGGSSQRRRRPVDARFASPARRCASSASDWSLVLRTSSGSYSRRQAAPSGGRTTSCRGSSAPPSGARISRHFASTISAIRTRR
jgi:integrase